MKMPFMNKNFSIADESEVNNLVNFLGLLLQSEKINAAF